MTRSSWAIEYSEALKLYYAGNYEQCIKECEAQTKASPWVDSWPRLLIQCYLTTGKYPEAAAVYGPAIVRNETSLRLRLLGGEVYRYNNDPANAKRQMDAIPEMIERQPWMFSGRDNLVPLGQYLLSRGEDARKVLEICFDPVIKDNPRGVEAYIASARLALDKHDDKVAATALAKAIEIEPSDPEIHYLSARAWSSSDGERAAAHLEKALELNPKHLPSLLMQVENRIDSESYTEAQAIIDKVFEVNPHQPIAWAYRAVIAHLEGRFDEEGQSHRKALSHWPQNPEVDYTIGKMLSQHYRFQEGVHYQRLALTFDSKYLPARAQLAQDLLRLGETEEGWRHVESVRKQDAYDVVTFNLSKLKETLSKFKELEAEGLVVRMDATEADIYGQQVLDLLSEVRKAMTEKYSVKLEEPIYVEIFPQQKDFAIRTFGLPGGEGFLGVCFGRLITANSPASQGATPSNWQSVLWHEYCHVVTLQKTKNRMPRWLSEGISVYEERERDRTWGQSMEPAYREMVLSDDLTPVSKLSSAFLHPKTPMHLQFAYYESSMVVEFLVEKFGMQTLKRILDDLSTGMSMNDALGRHTGSLEMLDTQFAEYLRGKAREFTGEAEYDREEVPKGATLDELLTWLDSHPNNVYALQAAATALIQSKQWDKAASLLERLQKLNPTDNSSGGVYALQAKVARERGDAAAERAALNRLAELSNDAMDTFLRLAELDQAQDNWQGVIQWCNRLLSVNPLLPSYQDLKATAAEKLQQPKSAVEALRALVALEPIDPAAIHYRLGRALRDVGENDQAKRQLLMALEEAPRYREALQLLVTLAEAPPAATKPAPEPAIAPPKEPANAPPKDESKDQPNDESKDQPNDESKDQLKEPASPVEEVQEAISK